MKLRIFLISGLTLISVLSCKDPVEIIPTSTITIFLVGSSDNDVTVSWNIHGRTGSQVLTLNHDNANPWQATAEGIDISEYGEVYITMQNGYGNQVVLSGDSAVLAPGGWVGSEKTLNLSNLGIPSDLSGVAVGDILEFPYPGDPGPPVTPAAPAYAFIVNVQNLTPPHQLTIKDSDNHFASGAFSIYSRNAAYFTVWIQRDGITLGPPKTYGVLIDDVDFSYGSSAW